MRTAYNSTLDRDRLPRISDSFNVTVATDSRTLGYLRTTGDEEYQGSPPTRITFRYDDGRVFHSDRFKVGARKGGVPT